MLVAVAKIEAEKGSQGMDSQQGPKSPSTPGLAMIRLASITRAAALGGVDLALES